MNHTASSIELNNLGVAFLDTDNLPMALKYFYDAFQNVIGRNLVLLAPDSDLQFFSPNCDNFLLMHYNDMLNTFADLYSSTGSSRSVTNYAFRSSGIFAYKKGISINHAPSSSHVQSHYDDRPPPVLNSVNDNKIIAATILFNVANTLHQKGIRISINKNLGLKMMNKARSYYMKCIDLLLNCSSFSLCFCSIRFTAETEEATGNYVIDRLIMALMNNMAQLSYELMEYENMNIYLRKLTRFALSVVPDAMYHNDVEDTSQMESFKAQFLLNGLILKPPQAAMTA